MKQPYLPASQTNTYVADAKSTLITILHWQTLARLIMKPVLAKFARNITCDFDENDLLPEKTYLAVSNHQSHFDAFVLIAGISPQVFQRLQPFRAMTSNHFLRRGPIKYAALRMGCFPAKPHASLPNGINYASLLIEQGQSVYICPEGKIDINKETSARPGVGILAKVPNVEIIPVHIKWSRTGRWHRSFQLAYGKPYDGSNMTAQEILDYCYALPLR